MRYKLLLLGVFAVGVGALITLIRQQPRSTGRLPPSAGTPTASAASAADGGRWIRQAAESLRGSAGTADATLRGLRDRLRSLAPVDAAKAIEEVLRSGVDAATGQDLKPGPNGTLASVSSLRVFLLDELRRLDPASAASLARSIVEQSDRPDEWAVALAIAAMDSSGAGQKWVRDAARRLAKNPAWQNQPTAGFLEAFDLFVYTRDTGFVPELTAMLAPTNNRALAHAAFLTLDRMVLADPTGTLGEFLRQPSLLAGHEATRAGYFARVDASDPAQRRLLETYLLSPGRSEEELGRWAGSFPSGNFMVSHNLLTPSGPPAGHNSAGRDRAALAMIQEWQRDPRFAAIKPRLESVRLRLETWLQPANR